MKVVAAHIADRPSSPQVQKATPPSIKENQDAAETSSGESKQRVLLDSSSTDVLSSLENLTIENEIASKENISSPQQPIAVKTWSNLFRSPPSSPSSTNMSFASEPSTSTPPSVSRTAAGAGSLYALNYTAPIILPRGLVNTGNMCFLNSVSHFSPNLFGLLSSAASINIDGLDFANSRVLCPIPQSSGYDWKENHT